MTEAYRIGNVILEFTHQFDEYFSSRIPAYKTTEKPEYRMRVLVEDRLDIPTKNIKFSYRDRTILEDESGGCIVKHNEQGEITHLIDYRHDYREITIRLSRSLGAHLPEVEYLITGMMFFEIAIKNGLIPIHASAIGYDKEAILFSGPSRAGKSTQAELWKTNLEDVVFINDDKPLLYQTEAGLFVTGSPWSGKTPKNENIALKVKAIVFIEQAQVNNLIALTVYDKITNFLRNVYRPREEAKLDNVLDLIEKLIKDLPVYRFYCTKDNEAFAYLYQALYRRDY